MVALFVLPQRGEGEVGDEPGPEGGGDEAGDGEGEKEAGESEEDDPQGAEGMCAGEGNEEPAVCDEADKQEAAKQEEALRDERELECEDESGPSERGEVGAGVIDEECAGGALPATGRAAKQKDAVNDDEAEEEKGRGQCKREEDRPGGHEGFSD